MSRARTIAAGLALCGGLTLCGGLVALSRPLPVEALQERPASWRVVDRDDRLLREVVGPDGLRARWAALDEISPWVIAGTVAVEDRRFYRHPGVDAVGVGRAALASARAGRVVQGASTLTMQLARLVQHHPRSPGGKVAQAIDAVRLERALDKDAILEQYLNRAYYGAGAVGVEAASLRTFGKPSRHLSLAEAALIAGLPQLPGARHPSRDPAGAVARQRQVLDAMLTTGAITAAQHARAIAEPLSLRDGRITPEAMHFVDHVMASDPPPGVVRTTLDRDLQRQIQRMTRDHVAALSSGGLRQAAVVVLEHEDCAVSAMVGSADWWAEPDGRINGALALRQPGSALKPFAYGLAFEGRYDPASVVADVPTQYLDGVGALMRPRNYSERFTGPVLMGEALGRSLNVPAIRTANAVGIDEVLALMQRAGLASLDRGVEHYGLGLVLGNGEISLLELATAYAIFPRGGVRCGVRTLSSDPGGDGLRVLSEAAAFLVSDVLYDEALRARAFGWDNPLQLGVPVAVKTGTSSNWRDSLAVGFTDRHVIAVWAGDFGGEPMHQLSGAIGAGPLFRQVVEQLVRTDRAHPPTRPQPPDGVAQIEVCALSGASPTEHCPTHRTVHVPTEHSVRPACSWHQPVRLDRRNGLRASQACPEVYSEERVFALLPADYAAWSASAGGGPPTAWSPLCPPDGIVADAVVVTHPSPGDVFLIEPGYDRRTQSVALSATVDPPVPQLTWWVDGQPMAQVGWPYEGTLALEPGSHEVVARVGERASEAVRFEVLDAP